MDLKTYIDEFLRSGGFVVGAVLALGSQLGKVGITGKAQLFTCMGIGFVSGAIYFLAVMGIPTTLQGWMFGLITAIIIAAMPSGLYEMLKAASKKANDELLAKLNNK